jgi:hypothetical protein
MKLMIHARHNADFVSRAVARCWPGMNLTLIMQVGVKSVIRGPYRQNLAIFGEQGTEEDYHIEAVEMGQPTPYAWAYELATRFDGVNYRGWEEQLSKDPPVVPIGSVRNVRPLYAGEPQ